MTGSGHKRHDMTEHTSRSSTERKITRTWESECMTGCSVHACFRQSVYSFLCVVPPECGLHFVPVKSNKKGDRVQAAGGLVQLCEYAHRIFRRLQWRIINKQRETLLTAST